MQLSMRTVAISQNTEAVPTLSIGTHRVDDRAADERVIFFQLCTRTQRCTRTAWQQVSFNRLRANRQRSSNRHKLAALRQRLLFQRSRSAITANQSWTAPCCCLVVTHGNQCLALLFGCNAGKRGSVSDRAGTCMMLFAHALECCSQQGNDPQKAEFLRVHVCISE